LDTSHLTDEEVAETILKRIKERDFKFSNIAPTR